MNEVLKRFSKDFLKSNFYKDGTKKMAHEDGPWSKICTNRKHRSNGKIKNLRERNGREIDANVKLVHNIRVKTC